MSAERLKLPLSRLSPSRLFRSGRSPSRVGEEKLRPGGLPGERLKSPLSELSPSRLALSGLSPPRNGVEKSLPGERLKSPLSELPVSRLKRSGRSPLLRGLEKLLPVDLPGVRLNSPLSKPLSSRLKRPPLPSGLSRKLFLSDPALSGRGRPKGFEPALPLGAPALLEKLLFGFDVLSLLLFRPLGPFPGELFERFMVQS